jgi:hypothetical protein
MNYLEAKILKNQYPLNKLLYINICDIDFVFRDITKEEYKEATIISKSKEEFEDIICQLSIIHPKDFDFDDCGFAGIASTIANKIIDFSAFTEKEMIKTYQLTKKKLETFEEQAKAMIKAAMPEYTYEEMNHWSNSKLIQEATRAEFILKDIKNYNIEWKLPETSNKENTTKESMNINIEEYCDELIKKGIDPIINLWESLKENKKEIARPLIGGFHWRNEAILSAIRNQIHKFG